MIQDKILVRRFNGGDRNALRRIYEKYKTDLLKVAAALLYDRAEIEDVLHDVFVSLARQKGSFKLTGSLKGYLAISTANRARDKNRLHQRRKAVGLEETDIECRTQHRPEQVVLQEELSQRLAGAMEQLPDYQREVIVLHHQTNLKFRQIAKSQGVSINTIQSRYRYGLDKLRSILQEELR